MADAKMTITGLVAIAIGILTLIVIYTVIPMVGSELDGAITLPASGAAGANWNSTNNADIPTAISFWESLGGILKVGAILVVIGGVLQTLRGVRG